MHAHPPPHAPMTPYPQTASSAMNSENTLTLLFVFIFVASGSACAGKQSSGQSFRASADQFSFERDQRTISIHLDVAVSGWAVNCSRTRAIVWGQDNTVMEMG